MESFGSEATFFVAFLETGAFADAHPSGSIEFGRIETSRQFGILLIIKVLVRHGPFSGSQHTVYPPMQEDTEAIVPKLLTGFQVLLRRLVSLRLCGAHKKKQQ